MTPAYYRRRTIARYTTCTILTLGFVLLPGTINLLFGVTP